MQHPFDNPPFTAAHPACGRRGRGGMPLGGLAKPNVLATPRAGRPGRCRMWGAMAPPPLRGLALPAAHLRQHLLLPSHAVPAPCPRGILANRRSSCSKSNRKLTSKR